MKLKIYFAGVLLLLAGCIAVPPFESRLQHANTLARQSGWQGISLPSFPYALRAFLPEQIHPVSTLSIYIEGDGLAWRSRRRVSSNPTPATPVALQLALLDQQTAAYLARPCQYVSSTANCDPSLWTSARFSEAVIAASNAAIDLLKQRFAAERLRLIGFSGGGGVAALLAARRDDVSQLVTVAGNLDHVAWTRYHQVSPLTDSLNPADAWQALQAIPQIHFVGENDRNIGTFVAESYRKRFPREHQPAIRIIKGANHDCCWVEKWPKLSKFTMTTQ